MGGWRFSPGILQGRPAILAFDAGKSEGSPAFFILVEWVDRAVSAIRDVLFARYVMDGADVQTLNGEAPLRS